MPVSKKQILLSDEEVYVKISSWCAYQERCHSEVREKLYGFVLGNDEIEEIIFRLISENFLNEERYAIAYAGGKFRMKKWGRIKIRQELKQKGLTETCIRIGLNEIDDTDYHNTIVGLCTKKLSELKNEKNQFVLRKKTADYVIRKGYEPDLVWQTVNKIVSE